MGCGCKKKNNDPVQPAQGQTVTTNEATTTTQTDQPQQPTQDQVIQVAVTLREMIENKLL